MPGVHPIRCARPECRNVAFDHCEDCGLNWCDVHIIKTAAVRVCPGCQGTA